MGQVLTQQKEEASVEDFHPGNNVCVGGGGGGGGKGGSTNVTIPVDLGNDLHLLEMCLHRSKEISCYERTLRNLYATGAVSNTISLHIVPRQGLTKCVDE